MSTERQDRYEILGVSDKKEGVHKAVKILDKGLFDDTFVKLFPDRQLGEGWCKVMSADGAGTKSILALLIERATGDASIWRNPIVDAIVMNTDDAICAGVTGPFDLAVMINRNASQVSDEAIAEMIKGADEFCKMLNNHDIPIDYMAGETADVGDNTRTVSIDAVVRSSIHYTKVVHINPKPGMLIVGLRSDGKAFYEQKENSGIGSNGLTDARHAVLCGKYRKDQELFDPEILSKEVDAKEELAYTGPYYIMNKVSSAGWTVADLLSSPTRTYAPVIRDFLTLVKPSEVGGIIHNTGGGHTKVMKWVPEGVRIVKDKLGRAPFVFELIARHNKQSWKYMYEKYNMGYRMEAYLKPADAEALIMAARKYNVVADVIGQVEEGEREVQIKNSHYGEFVLD